MSKQTVFLNAAGNAINIGPWQHDWRPTPVLARGGETIVVQEARPAVTCPVEEGYEWNENSPPFAIIDGIRHFVVDPPVEEVLRLAECGEVIAHDEETLYDANPIPDGAIQVEREIVTRSDGGIAIADDHVSLRRSAYPSLADQLDALWKGGDDLEGMRQRILSIKDAYPKE